MKRMHWTLSATVFRRVDLGYIETLLNSTGLCKMALDCECEKYTVIQVQP